MGFTTVCIPSRGRVTLEWAVNLIEMSVPRGTKLSYDTGHTLDVARCVLAKRALEQGAERVFFLDDDVAPPRNALARMMACQDYMMSQGQGLGGIVSGLYWLKWKAGPEGKRVDVQGAFERVQDDPPQYMAVDVMGPWKADPVGGDRAVVPVDAVPAGCLLIHRSVLEKVSKPWFQFNVDTDPPRLPALGEDIYFCEKAWREAGVRPVVMPSIACWHFGEGVFLPEGEYTTAGCWRKENPPAKDEAQAVPAPAANGNGHDLVPLVEVMRHAG